MEGVLAGEDEELPAQQWQVAYVAFLTWLNNRVAVVKSCNVDFDVGRGLRGLIHSFLQGVYVSAVVFKSSADLFFEVVNDDEIREKWDEVFDFEEITTFEEVDCSFDSIGL